MKDEMMAKIMDEVMKKMGGTEAPAQSMACEAPQGINEDLCGLTEYVGTAMGHTIGLVIANLDYSVHELLKIDPKYRSIHGYPDGIHTVIVRCRTEDQTVQVQVLRSSLVMKLLKLQTQKFA